jgi:hypothetical protein
MSNEKTPPSKAAALKRILEQFKGNSRATQCDRLRAALCECRTLNTVEIRQYLDIIHPAGRIQELREEGLNILTLWVVATSDTGESHRVANYVLLAEVDHA